MGFIFMLCHRGGGRGGVMVARLAATFSAFPLTITMFRHFADRHTGSLTPRITQQGLLLGRFCALACG